MSKVKQVIVVRTDLKMRKGKFASQVAHAALKIFFDRLTLLGSRETAVLLTHWGWNEVEFQARLRITEPMMNWMNKDFIKIVVGCDSLEELLMIQRQAEEERIINAIIEDNGVTEFKEKNKCQVCEGTGMITVQTVTGLCVECDGEGYIRINKPTITCLALGPDLAEKLDKITGNLKLL